MAYTVDMFLQTGWVKAHKQQLSAFMWIRPQLTSRRYMIKGSGYEELTSIMRISQI